MSEAAGTYGRGSFACASVSLDARDGTPRSVVGAEKKVCRMENAFRRRLDWKEDGSARNKEEGSMRNGKLCSVASSALPATANTKA